ncbi:MULTISPECIES: hypothetical protein [Rothia]|uniref:Uncharacterized protein n=1 Tax=Rothia nasimurium TaxID=85336 RepID=A0A1Y1RPY5_9MICC|nr:MULTISPECIES: hypothetical protein [Rothia]ORC16510.1 hypothetical protein A7979_04110 [Rothia nasimurium]
MADTPNSKKPSRYGRRLEDLSEDERAYYREFLPPGATPAPTPAEQPPAKAGQAAHERPTAQVKKPLSRWFWLPHSLTLVAVLLGVASFLVIPHIYADAPHDLRRNYVIMWAELAFFFLLFAALLYGIFFLARFSDNDDEDDNRLVRPTDFAERLYERDIERSGNKDPGDFYDSSWISGKK